MLKFQVVLAEVSKMQIMVPCHACSELKRPLSHCTSCDTSASIDADVSAWRLALHAHHIARVTSLPALPQAEELPAVAPRPLKLVLTVPDPAPPMDPRIASAEPLFESDQPLSFNWDEGRSRLRRTA
jgi:hypothetical protein